MFILRLSISVQVSKKRFKIINKGGAGGGGGPERIWGGVGNKLKN